MFTSILNFLKNNVIAFIIIGILGIYIGYLKYINVSDKNEYNIEINNLKNQLTTKEIQLSNTIQKYDSLVLENNKLKVNLNSFENLINEKNKIISDLENYNLKEIEKVLNLKIASDAERNEYNIISKESSDSIIEDINSILTNN